MSDLAERDKCRYRNHNPWTYERPLTPGRVLDINETLRNASREVQYHHRAYPKTSMAVALVWLFLMVCVVIGLGYLFTH